MTSPALVAALADVAPSGVLGGNADIVLACVVGAGILVAIALFVRARAKRGSR